MEPIRYTKRELGVELKVADIKVDLAYQRAIVQSRIRKLTRNFDPVLVGEILVARESDGSLYVIDGQHRVHTLRQLGQESVHAEVFEGLSNVDRGRLFLGRNDRSNVSQVDRDRSLATTEDPDTLNIDMAARAAGFVFLAEAAHASTFRDGAAAKVIINAGNRAGQKDPEIDGPGHLQHVLSLYATTYGTDERPESLVLKGLSALLLSKQVIDEERLVNVLKGVPPQVAYAQARQLQAELSVNESISVNRAMKRYLVGVYNQALPRDSEKRLKY